MGQLPAEERPIIGQLANEIRDEINTILNQQGTSLKRLSRKKKLSRETIDVTLPGKNLPKVVNILLP